MMRDIRNTALYKEIEALYTSLRKPGTGEISDAADIQASPDGRYAAFAATMMDRLEGLPSTRIGVIDLITADIRILTYGPNCDRQPRISPDGERIAFLSDRQQSGDFQLFLLDPHTGAARATPPVNGWAEYLHWSPDGQRVLLGVAGHGADVSGGEGAVASKQVSKQVPSWMPEVDAGEEGHSWRSVWIYELATDRVRRVSPDGLNVWEAVWCGDGNVAAIASTGPGEGLWYSACVHLIDLEEGTNRKVYVPRAQIGWPAASSSGKNLALIEGTCSDRWIVAGDLKLIDPASGKVRSVNTAGIDVSHVEWRSESRLLLAGHRGFESVVATYDTTEDSVAEVWSSADMSTGGRYIKVAGVGASGDCVLLGESFVRAPEVARIRGRQYHPIRSLDPRYAEHVNTIRAVERVTWTSRDGLNIQGWLLLPAGTGPHPLIMYVHGGPVWAWRPVWPGRTAVVLSLLKRGYAVFLPNPRGSTGRGEDFVRCVYADMGGADAQDLLSGIDALVARGVADPARLGVMGGSYGGFMTAWLVTQDQRFAAAVALYPHTNQVTQHLLSNIPHFMTLLLGERYDQPGGKYFERSPVMHARKVKSPTLNICGALDRCTPPEEAMQFHNALLENGVKSVLLTYPEEGHGVRSLPAAIDHAARVVAWFEEHLCGR